ncbi:MAG: 2-polyprenyl-6-methoxyphenol hydroxylase [Cyclobacteriaceae bacterium]
MKIRLFTTYCFGLSLLLASACTYDNEEDLFGENECNSTTSLVQDMQPIIEAHCAIPGCHVAGATSPNLTLASNIVNEAVRIRARTQNRTMPPSASGITLTEAEIRTIDCWVQQGAKDN